MSRNNNANNGWLRSGELTALAKPLAILLSILFSLTVHVNATLAASGKYTLCVTTIQVEIPDNQTPVKHFQIEHCGICVVANQYKSFGLSDGVEPVEKKSDRFVHPAQFDTPSIVNITQLTNIRGPPSPEFNKDT
jgi:hypothetical protein